MKRYVVIVLGFDGVECVAHTASKAKYSVYLRIREAGWNYTFKEFLKRVTVLHMGKAA